MEDRGLGLDDAMFLALSHLLLLLSRPVTSKPENAARIDLGILGEDGSLHKLGMIE